MWRFAKIAVALEKRGALAGLWASDNDRSNLPREKVHRCWPFHLAMKPIYHTAPQIMIEKASYAMMPIWRKWVRSQKPERADVVHAIMGYATEAFDHAERFGALKVIDATNSHPTSYFGNWQRECDLWCPGEELPIPRSMFARMNRELARADMILCPSTFVRDTMVQNGLSAEKCFINTAGVDTSLFVPRSGLPEKPRFVSVGTICVRKGHQYLFRAFEAVKRARPDAELICVGDFKADFRRERPKWEGKFTHYPRLDHQELSALLRTCSAFVLPSCEEGFARVIREAMASGLPVIATHESGADTVVREGVEGFIVPPCNPAALADAMLKIAGDPALCETMGHAAAQLGADTWQAYGDRLLAEYGRRLGAKSAGE